MRLEDLQTELQNYKSSPEVLLKMGEVRLYGIVAPYSSGKDSVIEQLISQWPERFVMVVGDASRPPRANEIEGVTHHFRKLDDMVTDLKAGRFVQVVPGFAGHFYATRPEQYPIDKIGVKPIQARAMQSFQKLNLKELKWLQIVPYSDEVWSLWKARRTYGAQDQTERDQEAIQSYELAFANPSTIYILNDSLSKAAARILQVADGKSPDDEELARDAAREIYGRLTD